MECRNEVWARNRGLRGRGNEGEAPRHWIQDGHDEVILQVWTRGKQLPSSWTDPNTSLAPFLTCTISILSIPPENMSVSTLSALRRQTSTDEYLQSNSPMALPSFRFT